MPAPYLLLRETCLRALDTYGTDAQRIQCMQECAEVIKVLTKMFQYPDDPDLVVDLAEEIADVTIMFNQMAMAHRYHGETLERLIGQKVEEKLKRLNERIDESQYGEVVDVGEKHD